MDNLVIQQNNQPITTSRMVARKFKRSHKNVLRAIRKLECSKEFNGLNFAPVDYYDAKNELRQEYHITKDGFFFLAMGFIGKEAAKFKEEFINAFNQQQEEINQLKNGAEINRLKEEVNELVLQYTVTGLSRQYGMMFLNDDAKTFTLHQAKNLIVPRARKWSYQLFVDSLDEIEALYMGVPTDEFIENGTFNHRCARKLVHGKLEEKHYIRVTGLGLIILAQKLGFLIKKEFDNEIIEKYRNCQLTFDDYKKNFKTLEEYGHEFIKHQLPNTDQLTNKEPSNE